MGITISSSHTSLGFAPLQKLLYQRTAVPHVRRRLQVLFLATWLHALLLFSILNDFVKPSKKEKK